MSSRAPPSLLRGLFFASLLGAGLGLGLFVWETERLLRSAGIGVGVEVEGPYAALKGAIGPLLPGLLARVAAVYALGGAVLGGLAGGLVRAWGGVRWVWMAPAWFLLLVLQAWDRALHRPALFDDLPALRPVLAWLVDHGAPWHPRLAAGLGLGMTLAVWGWRVRPGRRAVAAVAGVVALLAAGSALPLAGEARHPLVVLIGVDAFRPDRLRMLGGTGNVAPTLERFLGEGATLFTQAYTPIAQTEPAWRSLLTGRWPHRTGVRYSLTAESRWIQLPTFAGRFTEAGWRTVFATDCSRFHSEGPDSGFSTRLQPPRGAVNFLLEKLRYRGVGLFADHGLGAAWLPEFIDNRALAGIHDPVGYSERLAARLLAEARQGPTLFAFHATAAHFPGDPVYPYYRRFVAASEPLERRLRMHFSPVIPGGANGAGGWSREGAEALYDELLAQADAQVGRLLDALKRTGRYDDALIVLFSDHGESFHADHPELAGATPVHGARLSEEEYRVVLAVKPPRGMAAPKRVDTLVRLVDVGPTVLALAGLPALPADVDGVSLAPLLRGEPFSPSPLYAETGFTHVSPEVFDPGHWPGAPRAFDAYRIRPDGVVEVGAEAHDAMVREKDRGAFDGKRWLVDQPRAEGGVRRTCTGDCSDVSSLGGWLDAVQAP
ncbi:sulfatase-like hydrolase/transferase [Stigmatella sp. ncwal1]|uniref:Sulfatase-like hydrolase/transferase n=1 Tax=Stigmatella ashevillensis TaxID=2995309 RepID=A0ABT5DNE7_9BACT|nr:sulfatase-like hydrolase/transferase [Stigmatella ashevillena]MDC0715169.1 sulfatase-like hydrolase/transferase [Stigmatella ashevillena]